MTSQLSQADVLIEAKNELSCSVQIENFAQIVAYTFTVTSLDIEFEILFIGSGESEGVEKLPKTKRDGTTSGYVAVTTPGELIFRWSNSHSWYTSKHLSYELKYYESSLEVAMERVTTAKQIAMLRAQLQESVPRSEADAVTSELQIELAGLNQIHADLIDSSSRAQTDHDQKSETKLEKIRGLKAQLKSMTDDRDQLKTQRDQSNTELGQTKIQRDKFKTELDAIRTQRAEDNKKALEQAKRNSDRAADELAKIQAACDQSIAQVEIKNTECIRAVKQANELQSLLDIANDSLSLKDQECAAEVENLKAATSAEKEELVQKAIEMKRDNDAQVQEWTTSQSVMAAEQLRMLEEATQLRTSALASSCEKDAEMLRLQTQLDQLTVDFDQANTGLEQMQVVSCEFNSKVAALSMQLEHKTSEHNQLKLANESLAVKYQNLVDEAVLAGKQHEEEITRALADQSVEFENSKVVLACKFDSDIKHSMTLCTLAEDKLAAQLLECAGLRSELQGAQVVAAKFDNQVSRNVEQAKAARLISSEMDRLKTTLAEKEDALREITAVHSQVQSELTQTQSALHDATTSLSDLKTGLDIAWREKYLHANEFNAEQLRMQLQSEDVKHTKEVVTLSKQLAAMSHELSAKSQELHSERAQSSQMRIDASQLEASHAQLAMELSNCKQSVEDANRRCAGKDTECSSKLVRFQGECEAKICGFKMQWQVKETNHMDAQTSLLADLANKNLKISDLTVSLQDQLKMFQGALNERDQAANAAQLLLKTSQQEWSQTEASLSSSLSYECDMHSRTQASLSETKQLLTESVVELASSNSKVEALVIELKNLQTQLASAQFSFLAATNELGAMTAQHEQKHAKYSDQVARSVVLARCNKELTNKLATQEVELSINVNGFTAERKAHDETRTANDLTIKQCREEINQLASSLTSNQDQVSNLTSNTLLLQANAVGLSAMIDTLTSDLSTSKVLLADALSEVETVTIALTETRETLAKAVAVHDTAKTDLEANVQSLSEDVAALTSDLRTSKVLLADALREVETVTIALTETRETLAQAVAVHESAKTDLEANVQSLSEDVAALTSDLSMTKMQLATTEDELSNSQTAHAEDQVTWSQERADLDVTIEQHMLANDNLVSDNTELAEALEHKTVELDQSCAELYHEREQHNNTRDELAGVIMSEEILSSKIHDSEASLANFVAVNLELARHVRMLIANENQLETLVSKTTVRLDEQELENHALRQQLEDAQSSLTDQHAANTTLNHRLDEIQLRLTDEETEKQRLNEALSGTKMVLAAEQTDKQRLCQELGEKNSSLIDEQAENQRLQQVLVDERVVISNLRTDHSGTKMVLAAEQTDKHRLCQELEEKNSSLIDEQAKNQRLQQVLVDERVVISNLRTDQKKIRNQVTAHKWTLASRNTQIETLKTTLSQEHDENHNLRGELEVCKGSLEREGHEKIIRCAEIQRLTDLRDRLRRENGELQLRLESMTSQVTNTKALGEALSKECLDHGAVIKAKDEEILKMKRTLLDACQGCVTKPQRDGGGAGGQLRIRGDERGGGGCKHGNVAKLILFSPPPARNGTNTSPTAVAGPPAFPLLLQSAPQLADTLMLSQTCPQDTSAGAVEDDQTLSNDVAGSVEEADESVDDDECSTATDDLNA